jgi:hypothetical protein
MPSEGRLERLTDVEVLLVVIAVIDLETDTGLDPMA